MWANKTPQEAHEVLKKNDVTVTNKSDKESQLEKIMELNKMVLSSFEKLRPRSIKWLQMDGETNTLRINEEGAREILHPEFDRQLNPIVVCGALGTGKSYLMNSLLEADVFGVSDQTVGFTQGYANESGPSLAAFVCTDTAVRLPLSGGTGST